MASFSKFNYIRETFNSENSSNMEDLYYIKDNFSDSNYNSDSYSILTNEINFNSIKNNSNELIEKTKFDFKDEEYEDDDEEYDEKEYYLENLKDFNKTRSEKKSFIRNLINLSIEEEKLNQNTDKQLTIKSYILNLISEKTSISSRDEISQYIQNFNFYDYDFTINLLKIFDYDYIDDNNQSRSLIADYFLISEDQGFLFVNILNTLLKDPAFEFNKTNSEVINRFIKKLDFDKNTKLNYDSLIKLFENILNSKKELFLDEKTLTTFFAKYDFNDFDNQHLNLNLI